MSTPEQKHQEAICANRGSRTAPNTRTVTACLESDHRKLDAMLEEAMSLAGKGDFGEAQRAFAKFQGRLNNHIDAEEELLLPVYEQVCDSDAMTNVMLGEHADIRRLVTKIAESLRNPDLRDAIQAIPALTRLLGAHNLKEEQVVFPGTDAGLELNVERQALVGRIEERLER